ncbi:MAG: hypothetical protein AAF891_09390 [Pseudomonadota bacterium]
MKPKARFIASVTKTSKTQIPALPFQRGARRAAFIAKRNAAPAKQKTA